ncbi:uroporphyrinogen-III synthase [Alicyclobacillus sp.]|uniref:uroporphyrinogen-III synthase n=1 Tax=Alicyclobacillus sp. TaxID=61169 RepID=UPI0025C11F05|nr:uroporphyrinogen-III synthase [Alicyclobacillus sp.]MCL6517739.1 uroporphyrinogen-III synthase [Alicyclobacillus sp.]
MEGRPLAGWTVAITRPAEQGQRLAQRIQALGGRPWVAPLIAITLCPEAVGGAVDEWGRWDAVVATSANAGRALKASLISRGREQVPHPLPAFAVGRATAAALSACGLSAQVPPGVRTGADLAQALVGRWNGRALRVLYLHGDLADPAFAGTLADAGVEVEAVCAYHTREAPVDPAAWRRMAETGGPLAVALYSPSAVRAFATRIRPIFEALGRWPALVCIGPATARAAESAGLWEIHQAASSDEDGVVATLISLADEGTRRAGEEGKTR